MSTLENIANFVVSHIGFTAGAVTGSQYPVFIGQYVDVLRGHVNEAARNILQWQVIADKYTRGDLEQLVTRCKNSTNDFAVIDICNKVNEDVDRYQSLAKVYESITENSSWIERGYDFLKHIDPEIAKGVWENFNFAIPLTLESACYAGIGAAVVAGTYQGGRTVVNLISNKISKRSK